MEQHADPLEPYRSFLQFLRDNPAPWALYKNGEIAIRTQNGGRHAGRGVNAWLSRTDSLLRKVGAGPNVQV